MSAPLRLVIFDVDGTLVDSQADIVGGMGLAFEQVELPTPERGDVLACIGLSLPEAMAQLVPDADRSTQAALVDSYKQIYAELRRSAGSHQSSPLYPDVRETLAALHAQPETLLGVATGKSRRGLDILLDEQDLRRFFITAQCADDHPSKPHPSMLFSALSETGIEANQAVMVGDTRFDMEMSQAAGLDFIGVSWGYHAADTMTGAAAIIDDMRALPGALGALWERKK